MCFFRSFLLIKTLFTRKRKQGRPRIKCRKQAEENMRRIHLRKEDAADRCRWRKGIRVAEVARGIRPPSVNGNKTGLKLSC